MSAQRGGGGGGAPLSPAFRRLLSACLRKMPFPPLMSLFLVLIFPFVQFHPKLDGICVFSPLE